MAGFEGLEKFEKELEELTKHLKDQVLREATLKAVEPLIEKAAATAPRRKGELSRSITTQVMNAPPGEVIVRVGPGRPEGSHGILLEFGTVHMTARPFFASAFEATYQEVMENLENEVGNALRG